MPLQATSGAASYDGFGGGVPFEPTYIEQVFATHLYTGNGSTQTITTGIDLAGKGGMLWIKNRSSATNNIVNDTARGAGKNLMTNSTSAEFTNTDNVSALSSTGFSVGVDSNTNGTSGNLYASWTFRKQPKFFDVVTYTGNGTNNRQISHSLGSTPGCIIIKNVSVGTNWAVWHRSVNTSRGVLNLTNAFTTTNAAFYFGNGTSVVQPTSTNFTIGEDGDVNNSGDTFVAYLFAHDAGGFGLTGTDNVISCGSWTDSGSGTQTITLGYEPQFVIRKRTDASSNWVIMDTMRGWPVVNAADSTANLFPNLSNAESGGNYAGNGPTATGFTMPTLGGGTYIYIAIRRGPMKTPTTGTSVFSPTLTSATTSTAITVGFPTDSHWANYLAGDGNNTSIIDRLRGMSSVSGTNTPNTYLATASTSAESTVAGAAAYFTGANNTGWVQGSYASGVSSVRYDFRRAPGFFDVVCYTGNGVTGRQITHNLGVTPEAVIIKIRNSADDWYCGFSGSGWGNSDYLMLNRNYAKGNFGSINVFNNTAPTSSVFTVSPAGGGANNGGDTYVAYLFASCPGVSKVFSFTGNGSSQTINCGFTGGSRLVLIKRTDSTGNWVIFDSARGIVAGNDPALYLNSTAAEVTGVDAIDTDSTGFIVNQETTFNLNVNNATYIGLAIS